MELMGQEVSSNTILGIVWKSIASVGWYLFGLGIALCFASPYLQEKYNSWKSKKDEQEYAAKYHKDPDIIHERLSAVEEARQRMQEKYNKDAELARKKEEELRERKKQELLRSSQGQDSGNRLGGEASSSTSRSSKSNLLKDEYNPLMGNSSRGYRPQKRRVCGKGGCG